MSKLTALEVEKQQIPGRYADGNGLYLEVTKAGTKTWLFRYQLNGKRTQLGLGSYNKKTNSLAQARRAALDKKLLVAQGIHPKAHEERTHQELHEQRSTMTFEQCAEEWFANMQPQWSNKKTRAAEPQHTPNLRVSALWETSNRGSQPRQRQRRARPYLVREA